MPRRPKKSDPELPQNFPPLWKHPNGQYAKKIKGRLYYFGPVSNPQLAKENYHADILAIEKGLPRPTRGGDAEPPKRDITLRVGLNIMLNAMAAKQRAGEITAHTFGDYALAVDWILGSISKWKLLNDVGQSDFDRLRSRMVAGLRPKSVARYVQQTRTIFNWLVDHKHMSGPVDFGPDFIKPSKGLIRKDQQSQPRRFLDAATIGGCIGLARPTFKALVFMGANCGWGATDLAMVPKSAFDLERGVVSFPRPKTSIERRATLWPETIEAIRLAWRHQSKPISPDLAGRAFLTNRGRPWVETTVDHSGDGRPRTQKKDSVGFEFAKLLRKLGAKQAGVNFGSLRCVMETIGGETLDFPAVDRLMGHTSQSIAEHYRKWLGDEREDKRLRAVTDHVRAWLLKGWKRSPVAFPKWYRRGPVLNVPQF